MRRVLIVDDDLDFADEVGRLVANLGMTPRIAHDTTAALAALDWAPHVVILDIRLHGPRGDVTGLSILPDVRGRVPAARVLVFSGFITASAVEDAFSAGACDLVAKDSVWPEMLQHKVVRAAEEAARDMPPDDLLDAWSEARQASDPSVKGRALERAIRGVFTSIPGLTAQLGVFTGTEQIDVTVLNGAADPVLAKESQLWLVECKNHAGPVGVEALHPLIRKMEHRYERCKLGFLVSMHGFKATVASELRYDAGRGALVVLLSGSDIDAWLQSADRTRWLRDRVVAAACR